MTVAEFDNGYWYATEIKEFAQAIGIPHSNKLRKDELEKSSSVSSKPERSSCRRSEASSNLESETLKKA
jgi:hypothetical protein